MPGGKVCSVAVCSSNSQKTKQKGEKIMYFNFPKDPSICEEWVKKCYRKDKFSPQYKRICSLHFTLQDYEDEMKARLLHIPPRKLKKTAIPSLNLLPSDHEGCGSNIGTLIKEENDWEEIIQIRYEEEDSPSEILSGLTPEQIEIKYVFGNNPEQQLKALQDENELLKKENEGHEEYCLLLEDQVAKLKEKLKESESSFDKKVKELFKDFLTPNQVDFALKNKSRAWWNEEELSKAFTLRYLGKKSYTYLRDTLKYPLPGISTLQKWASNFNLRCGILDDFLRIMHTAGKNKTNNQRATVLTFYEIRIRDMYEYDQKNDEVVGPYSWMRIIIARALFDKWKQPVYVAFDKEFTQDILEDLIIKLHNIRFNVIACVSASMRSEELWGELEIDPSKTFFEHPINQEAIYFFADVPLLLKQLRNRLIHRGFFLDDGTTIKIHPITNLIESTHEEIRSCHQLTPRHITITRKLPIDNKLEVKLATELFSKSTATALQCYTPGDNEKLARDVGDFIMLVSSWYDIMNSSISTTGVSPKKHYGMDLERQNEVLEEMKATVSGMVVYGCSDTLDFQDDILISTASLQQLYLYRRDSMKAFHILTHRLTQDNLENLLSQPGTVEDPHYQPISPLEALYRIRVNFLGKNPGTVKTHTNIAFNPDDETEYLVASALKKANIKTILEEPSVVKEEASNVIEYVYADDESNTSLNRVTFNSTPYRKEEKDATLYVAGYIARQKLKTYEYLGNYTDEGKPILIPLKTIPLWIQTTSFGSIVQPSEEWMSQVDEMEKKFLEYHKDTFNSGVNIVKRTVAYVQKGDLKIAKDLIQSYCRLRIFARIKYFNKIQDPDPEPCVKRRLSEVYPAEKKIKTDIF